MIKDYAKITKDDIRDIIIPYNYHSHTYLCNHARGMVKDYVEIAIQNNLKSIGVSDHIANPLPNPYYINLDRIKKEYLPQFLEAEKLYSSKINIFRGGEVEYLNINDDYYKELKNYLDYLVLGEHVFIHNGKVYNAFIDINNDDLLKTYYQTIQQGIKTGFFSILAHPDLLFFGGIPVSKLLVDKLCDTLKCANDYGVKVEINAGGVRGNGFKYPSDTLIDCCVKTNCSVVISSDAHDPLSLCDDFTKKLYFIAKKNNLNIANDGFIKNKD